MLRREGHNIGLGAEQLGVFVVDMQRCRLDGDIDIVLGENAEGSCQSEADAQCVIGVSLLEAGYQRPGIAYRSAEGAVDGAVSEISAVLERQGGFPQQGFDAFGLRDEVGAFVVKHQAFADAVEQGASQFLLKAFEAGA